MPILPPEPDLFPPDLFDRQSQLADPDRRWWAMYTLARHEKELMRRLRSMGIHHYGPIIAKRSKSPQGRVRVTFVPLFASYVFVFGDETDRYQTLTTRCVSRCLPVNDGHELLRDLRQIRRLIESGKPVLPESKIEPGTPVRIRTGPLAGIEGVVLRRRGGERLLVAVRFIQQGASIELEDFEVEPLER